MISFLWTLTHCALADVTLYLRPDCPSPTDAIQVIAQSFSLPVLGPNVLSFTLTGNMVNVTVQASAIQFIPLPSQSTFVIAPLPIGDYRLNFFTRYKNADGTFADAELAATRTFTVQENPPACTPAKIGMASGTLQTTLVSQPFAQPIQVLVQDDKGRPVPGVTVAFSRMYVDEDFAANPSPSAGANATFSASTVTTDSMGIASVTATANATLGVSEYMALAWRPDIQYKAYFVLGQLGAPPTEQLVPVVEFYNSQLAHYFITVDDAEMLQLDSGVSGTWKRTGAAFLAAPRGTMGSDLQPVCRFYGSVSPGPNSHFYTVDPEECSQLKVLQSVTPPTEKRWNYEAIAFDIRPQLAQQCSYPQSTPVYRAYNNGFSQGKDSNHRFTTSQNVYQSMIAMGWIGEGLRMCASQ